MKMKRMKGRFLQQYVHWGIANYSPQIFIILFSILCFITSCNNEYVRSSIDYDTDINNEAASMFIQALDNDNFSKERLQKGIDPYDVFFDAIEMSQSTTYGLCYIIPYGVKESKKVMGAVYYPVEYFGVNEDNTIEFNNILKNPRFVDSDVMNNEIKMNEGFIYSDYFYNLKDKGLTPDEGLLKYMYLLRNPQKLEASISNLIKPSSTRMYVPGGVLLSIILEANFTNRPNNSGIIYGVSQETIQSIVRSFAREKSEQHGCRIEVVRFNAASYGNILIDLSSDSTLVGSDWFVREFIYELMTRITNLGVNPKFQYTYFVDDLGAGESEGGNTAGESNTGGSPGNDNNNNQSAAATEKECESMNSVNTKLLAGSLVTYLQEAEKGNYSQTELLDWRQFSNFISENPTNEHSINLENLPNGIGLAHPAHGGPNSAGRSPNSTTIACMHNHPNETPPSPKDLLNFIQTCMDPYLSLIHI